MNSQPLSCRLARRQLIDLAYDEAQAGDARRLREHLEDCDPCRQELELYRDAKELLEMAAAFENGETKAGKQRRPRPSTVQSASLLRRFADKRQVARTRWKWLAGTLAVLLLIAMTVSLRLEIHATHLIVRWGNAAPSNTADLDHQAQLSRRVAQQEARLAAIDQLMEVMVDELHDNDRRFHQLAFQFQQRLDSGRQQNEQRWRKMRRSIHTLSLAPPDNVLTTE